MEDEYDFQERIARHLKEERLARKILGVAENADAMEIKKAFWRLAMRYHPDKNPGNDKALRRFVEALNAYEFLNGKVDHLALPEEEDTREELIGKYRANEWGFFCHWRETFMDDFVGKGFENSPDKANGNGR